MDKYWQQAEQTLSVFLSRTIAATKLLKSGDIDAAIEKLRWQAAAFHNFRVLDFLYNNKYNNKKFLINDKLYTEIVAASDQLADEIANVNINLRHDIDNIVYTRQTINKYMASQDRINKTIELTA